MNNPGENGVLEDIAGEIGYTATNALVDWFGGGNLHIPTAASDEHPIACVIGMAAMRRLVKLYEGRLGNQRLLWLPMGYEREIVRRDRLIAALFSRGVGTQEIMRITHMSERHVQTVRRRLEDVGLMPLILRPLGEPEKP